MKRNFALFIQIVACAGLIEAAAVRDQQRETGKDLGAELERAKQGHRARMADSAPGRRAATARGSRAELRAGRAARADRSAVSLATGYVGGTGVDEVRAMARDAAGNLILAGYTASSEMTATGGAVEHAGGNAFVQKVKGDGSAVIWRAIVGGARFEEFNSVAVDAAGAVYLAGSTTSTDMPVSADAFQKTLGGGEDGIVAKLSADGKTLVYCTYLGGTEDDYLNSISVDASGRAAVTGYTDSTNFPTPVNSALSAYSSGPGAIIAKLDAAGKALSSGAVLSGNDLVSGESVVALADGTTVVAVDAWASDLPVVKGWQKQHRGAGMWSSVNGGVDWTPSADGMRGVRLTDAALDAKNPQVMLAVSGRGAFRSTDGGKTWTAANAGLGSTDLTKVALDPQNPAKAYVASVAGTVSKSKDGGLSWASAGVSLGKNPYALEVDPQDGKILWAGTAGTGTYKSIDEGETWSHIEVLDYYVIPFAVAIHPKMAGVVYVGGYNGVYRTGDGGQTWARVQGLARSDIYYAVTFDPREPNTMYAASYLSGVYKSTDGGASWQLAATGIPSVATVLDVRASATQANLVFAATDIGVYRSANGGQNWTLAAADLGGVVVNAVRPDPINSGVVYAAGGLLADVYVTHLDKDGRTTIKSTYLGGARDDVTGGLAVDAAGNIYVAGGAESVDFPVTAGAVQATHGGDYDGFLVKLDKQGAGVYSTLLGEAHYQRVRALRVDESGIATLAGTTEGAEGAAAGGGGLLDVFVLKTSTEAPAFAMWSVAGGSLDEIARGVEVTPDGIWVAGDTASRGLSGGLKGLSEVYQGAGDGFLMKFSGLAASFVLEAESVTLEVRLDGSAPVVEKKLKVTSAAGALPLALKVGAGAAWLKAKAAGGEITLTADATGLEPGEYGGEVEVSAPMAGAAAAKLAVKLKVLAGVPPAILTDGVLHGAEMISGPVSPGLAVRVRGVGFTSGARVSAPAEAALPAALGGVKVTVNGVAAPLEWVSESEIALIVPYAVSGAEKARIMVERNGSASEPAEVAVAATAPGLFTADGSGTGQALAKNEDGTVNSAATPAERGRPVVLQATGEGVLDPALGDGVLAIETLSKPVAGVEVTIGGISCDVYYAGSAPVKPAGYMELNLKVPDEAPVGEAVEVKLKVGGVESRQKVTIAVK